MPKRFPLLQQGGGRRAGLAAFFRRAFLKDKCILYQPDAAAQQVKLCQHSAYGAVLGYGQYLGAAGEKRTQPGELLCSRLPGKKAASADRAQ